MKMGIFFSAVVWGAFFVLLGLSVFIKHIFNLDIPVIRFFFAFFLIYLGVQIILGGFRKEDKAQAVVCGEGKMAPDREGHYNVVFGKGVIDLTALEIKDQDVHLEANTVFGSSEVKISGSVPTLIKANAAFGNAQLPDGNAATVGTYLYKNKAYREGKPCLTLNLSVVFGEVKVTEQ